MPDITVPDPDRPAHRLARLSAWASFAAAASGTWALWHAPPLTLPSVSTSAQVACGLTALLVWWAGASPVTGADPAHARLRGWAPPLWAFLHAAWPGVAGLAAAYAVGVSGLSPLAHTLQALAALCLALAAAACLSHTGAALTLQPPWPASALLASGFAGHRNLWVWIGLAATAVLNALTVFGSARLLELSGVG